MNKQALSQFFSLSFRVEVSAPPWTLPGQLRPEHGPH